MIAKGYIQEVQDNYVTVCVPIDKIYLIDKQQITDCEVRFDDGRTISAEQRRKAYALINDISNWSGHLPEPLKEWFKYDYIAATGADYFSLSDCTVTTGREFISYLIDFCFDYCVPTTDTLLNRTDDMGRYLYACLAHRKCAVCNEKGEVHHITGSKVGMGFNRKNINHLGCSAITLCRKHHWQAHNGEKDFFEKYHLFGVALDDYLIKELGL